MTDAELQVIAKGMAPVVAELVEKRVAALVARIAVLEQRQAVPGRDGRDGNSISVGYGPPAFDGKASDVYVDVATGDLYQCR